MRLPKIGSTIKYKGRICEVKKLGNKATLLEEGNKKAFSVPISKFSKVYEQEIEFPNGEEENGNGESENVEEIQNVYAEKTANGDDHETAVKGTADQLGVSEQEVETAVANGGDDSGDDENGNGDDTSEQEEEENGGDGNGENGEEEEEMEEQSGNFGIPAGGSSSAVDKLPPVREFLASRAYERQINESVAVGDVFRLTGKIKNVAIHEQKEEDKPHKEEGSKPKKDPENIETPKADDPEKNKEDDPKIKEKDPVDLDKGDNIEVQNIDPKKKEVIAKFGDKEIELSTDDFVEKGSVLERVNEEEESQFGKEIAAINKWFEGEGGYTDSDSFNWDGETLTITKDDGSTETKSREEISDILPSSDSSEQEEEEEIDGNGNGEEEEEEIDGNGNGEEEEEEIEE